MTNGKSALFEERDEHTADTIKLDTDVKPNSSWSLWLRQILAIMRSISKEIFGSARCWIYLLAALRRILALIAIMPPDDARRLDFSQYRPSFRYLQHSDSGTVIFFGCAGFS